MTKSRVMLDFPHFRWSDLIHFAMYISLLLFACTLYGNPPFTKLEFDAAIKDFQTKAVAAMDKDPNKIKLRDLAWTVLLNMLRQLVSYVEMECVGDGAKIAESGFNVYTPKGHSGTAVFGFTQGLISGEAIGDWPSIANAKSYVIRYFINEDVLKDVFTQVNVGKIGCTINDLIKLKEYGFSLSVVFSDHQGEFCPPVFLTIL